MGNTVNKKSSFNIQNSSELKEFLTILNSTDGFYHETNLSVSSKCLVIINNLINHMNNNMDAEVDPCHYQNCEIIPGVSINCDKDSFAKIEKLRSNCSILGHLSVFNNSKVQEIIELNNFSNLRNLHLENIPIRCVRDLKSLREKLLKLSVHESISDLDSLIALCGADQSFKGDWKFLRHLDIRYNQLKYLDGSVRLLTNLSVLDVSRNELESLEFLEDIPSLCLLNASYNCIKFLPKIKNHCIKVLIIAYNYIEDLEEIKHLKCLTILNASYNLIVTKNVLLQLNELDNLKDLVLKGNPICHSQDYRTVVYSVLSHHIMIDFTLDGRKFTKKERDIFPKLTTIIIQPPSSSSSTFHDKLIVKPSSRQKILKIADPSTSRKIMTPIDVDHQEERDKEIVFENTKEKDSPRKERQIVSVSEDIDSSMFTSDDFISKSILYVKNRTCYISSATSNLFCVSDNERHSFFKVSIQILEDKFMAVDERKSIVDNINIFTLLYVSQETSADKIVRLLFYDESIPNKDSKHIYLLNRTIEFTETEDIKNFLEEIQTYSKDFTITFNYDLSRSVTVVSMSCTRCLAKYQFTRPDFRPLLCKTCNSCSFKLEKPMDIGNQGLDIEKLPCNTPSPAKSKLSKSDTSKFVIDAMSVDTQKYSTPEATISENNSFMTAEDLLDQSIYPSQLDLLGEVNDFGDEDPLQLEKPVNIFDISVELECHKEVVSVLPEKNLNLEQLTFLAKSKWIVYHPLSHVNVYMHDITKIHDRIKIHFLTTVLSDNENIVAAFKCYIVHKTGASFATEALVIISSVRILLYSWVDKDMPSFDECLKLIGEIKLKNLKQIDDCLNHQWLEITSKNMFVTLFIGDAEATLGIMQNITEVVTGTVARLKVRTLKNLEHFKCPEFILELMKEMDNDCKEDILQSSDFFLLKSCSEMQQTIVSDCEYGPKVIGFVSDHIFLINIKFKSKSSQLNFELYKTLTLYNLSHEITISQTNEHQCILTIMENENTELMELEFMSCSARSRALLAIQQLWKKLFQADVKFEFIDTQDPSKLSLST